MTSEELPPLSEAQLEILNIIWDRGKATVGDVWKVLGRRRPIARNTVLTMITRLEEKGWLRHRASRGTYYYSVTHPREKVLPRLVGRLVDAAFQGSAEGLVLSLLEGGRLSAEEIERIKAMLDKAESELREREP
jgi:predicted transcriptional regulator